MFGEGLIKGLGITLNELFKKKVTINYPEEIYPLPDRFMGRFKIDKGKCISCGMCVRACPNKVITLQSETVARKKRLLKYVMDIKYCLFCGLCVEACPTGALGNEKDFELSQYKWENLPLVLVDDEPLPEEEKKRLEEEARKALEAKKAAAQKKEAEATAAKPRRKEGE